MNAIISFLLFLAALLSACFFWYCLGQHLYFDSIFFLLLTVTCGIALHGLTWMDELRPAKVIDIEERRQQLQQAARTDRRTF